jgi:endoglucanase
LELKEILRDLTSAPGISGYETQAAEVASKHLNAYSDEVRIGKIGNVVAIKRGEQGGEGDERRRILLAAHLDEIGLMVTKVEDDGFLRISAIGGVDSSILPGQEVTVLGKRALRGVIGAKPPHLQSPGEAGKLVNMNDLYIDVGKISEEVEKIVEVGMLARIESEFLELLNDHIVAQALDDRAGVAAMVETMRRLTLRKHAWDVYAIATAQEEFSGSGASGAAFGIQPQIAIAIDVTYGAAPGLPERRTFAMNKGPAIGTGPNFHPKISQKLCDVAKEHEIPYQLEPSPYPSGTDAVSIQISRSGIPCGLLSIPLRNMHTTVEMLKLEDIKRLAELLSIFISELDTQFEESLKCF